MDEGWLPPEDECPELAALRVEHLRLLGVVADASGKLGGLLAEARDAEESRDEAVREAILAGSDPGQVTVAPPDPAVIERARRDYESAVQALTIFVERARAEIEATAPAIEEGVADRLRLADEKRQEARRLLAEADRLAAEPERLLRWLDRYVTVTDTESGEQRKRSTLGPIAFSLLDLPTRVPPPDLIAEMVLGPGEAQEVGSDEITDEEKEAMAHAR